MQTYVALLRGITPTNPNMSNAKLRNVFESLGYSNVRSVISSGNILFDASALTPRDAEYSIEQALLEQLGLTKATTLIRDRAKLQELLDLNPFERAPHTSTTYTIVTFMKRPTEFGLEFPYRPDGKAYVILAAHGQHLFSIVDLTAAKTPDLTSWLERKYGKDITTRTFKTIGRIVAQM
jgi:uncharacterized protein (DUF1697 family)